MPDIESLIIEAIMEAHPDDVPVPETLKALSAVTAKFIACACVNEPGRSFEVVEAFAESIKTEMECCISNTSMTVH